MRCSREVLPDPQYCTANGRPQTTLVLSSVRIPAALSDNWRADCTLLGPPAQVLEGLEAWRDAGIKTPVLVPSSANGGQMKAFEEMFALFEG